MLFHSLSGYWTRILLLLAFASVSYHANAQNITLTLTDASFKQAMDEVKRQSGYDVFYKDEFMDKANPIKSLHLTNTSLKTALDSIFQSQPFNYSILGKTIVLTYKKVKHTQVNQDALTSAITHLTDRDSLITGMVKDSTGTPLRGISVRNLSRPGLYSLSKSDGAFTIAGTSHDILSLSAIGYITDSVEFTGKELTVRLKYQPAFLKEVQVESFKPEKKDPTTSIDMTMRNYMNLGQILQGTVPGLSLQVVNSTTKKVIAVNVYRQYRTTNSGTILTQDYIRMTTEEFLNYKGKTEGQRIINGLLDGTISYSANSVALYELVTTTSITNTIVPQVRGANSFVSSSSNMLVIIDGFPQDGFPADYPMNNVESIDVIKDPAELLKWGPSAAGGIIMIRTKGGKRGNVKINYASNYYYAPAIKYSAEKFRQTNTSDYLNYQKDYDSVFTPNYDPTAFSLSPSSRLLAQLRRKIITKESFNKSWDSLRSLSNETQLRMLQQNAFSQNHTLTLSGGGRLYSFSLTGTYSNANGNGLNNNTKNGSVNLNSHWNLLNNKLNIDLLVKYGTNKVNAGYAFDPSGNMLDPYQLLLDDQGKYIYNYPTLSPAANELMMSKGYKNYGVNILEDARANSSISRTKLTQTRLNINWNIADNLSFKTSVYASHTKNNSETLYGQQSSYARQLADNYGELIAGTINYYIPYGNIFHSSSRTTNEWNVRTGLFYDKKIGKHTISASVGAGAASTRLWQPVNYTQYAYNTATKTGAPVFLPSPTATASIKNFYTLFEGFGTTVNPYTLITPTTGDTSRSRSINYNVSLAYTYNDKLTLSGNLNNSLSPLYGQEAAYSVLSNYVLDATYLLFNQKGERRLFNSLAVSTGATGIKMPNLPVTYTNLRYQQVYWNNYTIWVNGVNPTQQKGQNSVTYYEKLTWKFFEKFSLDVAYNTNKISAATAAYSNTDQASDSSYQLHYMSAGLKALLRHNLLNITASYSKSPEGQSQANGNLEYDIARERFFHSNKITTLRIGGLLQNISPYQGLSTMMSTNVGSSNSGYSLATNNDFSLLPPKNINWEIHGVIGANSDRYLLDLRYYNRTTSGLNNYLSTYTDPATGVSSQVSYSTLINKGIEFFLKNTLVKKRAFTYTLTLNGAYNVNVAKTVPAPGFSATDNYVTALRNGYNTSSLWTYKWAGLNTEGDPQIYNNKGEVTHILDSTTLASSLVYAGALKAPWTGGLIQEFNYKRFFARTSLVFNWGYVMKYYMPNFNSPIERSSRTKDHWRKAGDEQFTDVPRMISGNIGTYRSYLIQNTSNNIITADNIRLQEVMVGWNAPANLIKRMGLTSLTVTAQVQNAAVWARNKYRIDPTRVGSDGKIGTPIPRQYSCTLNIGL